MSDLTWMAELSDSEYSALVWRCIYCDVAANPTPLSGCTAPDGNGHFFEPVKPRLATGYNCTKCGERHAFPSYVFAHWDEKLSHRCEKCLTNHRIFRGVAK